MSQQSPKAWFHHKETIRIYGQGYTQRIAIETTKWEKRFFTKTADNTKHLNRYDVAYFTARAATHRSTDSATKVLWRKPLTAFPRKTQTTLRLLHEISVLREKALHQQITLEIIERKQRNHKTLTKAEYEFLSQEITVEDTKHLMRIIQ